MLSGRETTLTTAETEELQGLIPASVTWELSAFTGGNGWEDAAVVCLLLVGYFLLLQLP